MAKNARTKSLQECKCYFLSLFYNLHIEKVTLCYKMELHQTVYIICFLPLHKGFFSGAPHDILITGVLWYERLTGNPFFCSFLV